MLVVHKVPRVRVGGAGWLEREMQVRRIYGRGIVLNIFLLRMRRDVPALLNGSYVHRCGVTAGKVGVHQNLYLRISERQVASI